MFILKSLVIILLVHISSEKDIELHYPTRVNRCDEDEDSKNVVGVLAQIISLVVFVFYILIILGLIKACLGCCCNTVIGELGLDLILDPCSYNKNTVFCINLIFFLVLPFALLRRITWRPVNACPEVVSTCPGQEPTCPQSKMYCEPQPRMCGGETKPKSKSETKTQRKPSKSKKKKGNLEVYKDGNESETQDTKYVLEQLHRSEQSLKNGIFTYTIE